MPAPRLTARRAVVAAALVAGTVSVLPSADAGTSAAPVTLTVLSSRPDLVSGGSALVRVDLARRVKGLVVTVGRRDVSAAFARRSDGAVEGLVDGLSLGRNVLRATLPDGHGASLTLVDHPIGGPLTSGPQIQPWTCSAGAQDSQCNRPPTYTYSYVPVGTTDLGISAAGSNAASPLQPYDPANPPPAALIASTTTQTGVTVPFIVRQETGVMDRDEYRVATLYQPGKPWTATAPQPQFNHKLVLTHGASCDTAYEMASAPDVLLLEELGAGFAVASHALDNAGHNCSIATEAESLLMTKEHVVKAYGPLKWTIGSGCSGGSLVQQQVANAYPGLYQGISPQCSFTDAWSSAMQYEDYVMLLKYFEDPSRWSPGTAWDPVAISQVLDHPNIGNPITFTTAIPNSGDPSRSCPGVPDDQVYDPQTNPGGLKCTLEDYMVNVFGKRPDGSANRPFSNEGIQYGLQGLRAGLVSPQQFVDLNTHLGGLDYDGEVQAARSAPDVTGLTRAYRSGAVDSANNLDQVAIIDLRGPDPGAFHDVYRTYAMRARLLRNFGTAANQVLWRGQVPLIGDKNYADQAIFALDSWIASYTADTRSVPLAQKIREDKPGTIGDRCTDGAGTDLPETVCDTTVQAYGTPRIGADGPLADDTLACRLKPMRQSDYPVTFTADQWAALQQAFPGGVCDYSKPGLEQRGAVAWLTYQDEQGRVVYGGKPLGPVPVSKSF